MTEKRNLEESIEILRTLAGTGELTEEEKEAVETVSDVRKHIFPSALRENARKQSRNRPHLRSRRAGQTESRAFRTTSVPGAEGIFVQRESLQRKKEPYCGNSWQKLRGIRAAGNTAGKNFFPAFFFAEKIAIILTKEHMFIIINIEHLFYSKEAKKN